MAPAGPIQTKSPGGGNFATDWPRITRFDAFIHEAADPVSWPIERVRGHIVIESQGNPEAVQRNPRNGDSFGLMQVVPFGVGWDGWHRLVRKSAGLSAEAPAQKVRQALTDPRTNIRVGVSILETLFRTHGSLDAASSAFFTGTPDWFGQDTQNFTTGRQYRDTLNALIAEQAGGAEPDRQVSVDPLQIIFGGNPAPVHFGHGELNTVALYHYGVGHGTDSPFKHTGIDVSVPYHTPIHTPAAGEVLCVGDFGSNIWGQGCGAFNDTGDSGPGAANIVGIGNITILLDTGYKLTFGHCRQALVAPGQRVAAGQQIGTSGGMFGAHTHIDVAVDRPDLTGQPHSPYWLLDPAIHLRAAMGDTSTLPVVFAPLAAVPQPQEWENSVRVTATRDDVPVLQRAGPNASPVRAPLSQGEEFDGVMVVLGSDGAWYWVSRTGARIPVDGTAAADGPRVPAS